MKLSCQSRGGRIGRASLFLSSAIVLTLTAPGAVRAACAPGSPQPGESIVCSGEDRNGLVIRGAGTNVLIEQDATLSTSSASTIDIFLQTDPYVQIAPVTLQVDGTVEGGVQNAITIGSTGSYQGPIAQITVSETGRIAAPVAINLQSPTNSNFWYLSTGVELDNGGAIISTSGGLALHGSDDGQAYFTSIVNRSTGTMGAIQARVHTLVNDGLIDGGALSAFAVEPAPLYFSYPVTIQNNGTIQSSGAADTLSVREGYIQNSGTIIADGTGRAISGNYLNIDNQQSGQVVAETSAIGSAGRIDIINAGTISAGGDAIVAGEGLLLVNTGTIVGDVRGGDGGSTITNIGGTIDGNVLLGAGNDVFFGDASQLDQPFAGVTGRVDAGGGIDMLAFNFTQDIVLERAVPLPDTFEMLSLRVGGGSTVTFSEDFTSSRALVLGSADQGLYDTSNKFVLGGTVDTDGPAVVDANYGGSGFVVANTGTIVARLNDADAYAVLFQNASRFENSGTITASGGGGLVASSARVFNSGVIIADATAVTAWSGIENSGVVRSNSGAGIDIQYGLSSNSGAIEGATAGARLSGGKLVNSGTIASQGAGLEIGSRGVVINEAGGTIAGGTMAIAAPATDFDTANVYVVNAGTISGDVALGGSAWGYYSGNIFVAAAGGIVDGDIHLGSGGDIFATSLVNDGPGEFAGITGRVTSDGSATLRYLVDADATVIPKLSGIFTSLSYQVAEDATLTLAGASDTDLAFAGLGKVVLTGNMTGDTSGTMIDLGATAVRTDSSDIIAPTAITFVNQGMMTVRETSGSDSYYGPAISVGDGRFVNEGVVDIRLAGSDDSYIPQYRGVFVANGAVINDGVIRLSGATGIKGDSFYTDSLIQNNGVIEQVSGGARSVGISGGGTIINRGRIDTEGVAVDFSGSGSLINSGIIRSSAAEAVRGSGYYTNVQIWNRAGGLIAGGADGPTIALGGGSILSNEGTIQGDVSLGDMEWPYSYTDQPSIYVNRGGTLNGNLTLTERDDIVIALNGDTGVTGAIEAGEGSDIFVRGFDASTDATLGLDPSVPNGFERVGYAAYGTDTVVTLSGSASRSGPLLLVGDGSIVNTAVLSGFADMSGPSVMLGSSLDPLNSLGAGSTLSFVNQGTLSRGIQGSARAFDNQGTVLGYSIDYPSVRLTANDATGFSFRNSGIITAVEAPQDVSGGLPLYTVSITRSLDAGTLAYHHFDNSGQIAGGVSVTADTRSFRFSNAGQIDAANPYYPAVELTVGPRYGGDYPFAANAEEATIANSGVVNGAFNARLAAKEVSFANSGSIAGYLSLSQDGELDPDSPLGYPEQTSQDRLNLTNSGTIQAAAISSAATSIIMANSGTIGEAAGSPVYRDALSLSANSFADRTVDFVNDGRIVSNSRGGSSFVMGVAGWTAVEGDEGAAAPSTSINIVNSGTISAEGGAGYTAAVEGSFPSPALLTLSMGLGISASGSGASDVTIVNREGATISATGETGYLLSYWEPESPDRTIPEAYAATGTLAVGVAADTVVLDNAGTITGQAGGVIDADTASTWFRDDVASSGTFLAGAVQTYNSVDTLINRSSGVITGSIDLGAKDDQLINAGIIDGAIYLGAGDDSMVQGIGGTLTGRVDGGEGVDAVVVDISGGGTLGSALMSHFVNFESKRISGSGTVATDGPFADETIYLRDAALTLAAGQTWQSAGPVAVTFDGGTNLFVNQGRILGSLDMSNGLNQLVNDGTIMGDLRLGEGNRVTGLAGSVITGSVDVGRNSVFASAGTVNGAVSVSGTLAPGASLGTLTINGNVTLGAGSNSLFEFTPVLSDALVINGSLSITEGASLTLTGDRPMTPGVYTIVSASEGINGSFGVNVLRDEAIEGVLSFEPDAIRLIGLFQSRDGTSAQVGRTQDYLNALLLSGEASSAFLAAVPQLVDADGYANPMLLSSLSPEPYASVAQVGIENGLAVTRALRSVQMAGAGEEGGLLVFGQSYGNYRMFKADHRGVAQADVDSWGYLGGIGYGNTTLGAALFVGHGQSKQRLGRIGARNEADGIFFGGRLHYANGGFGAGATLLFDRAKADTSRNPATGGSARSRYDLHGTTMDGWVSYAWEMADGWRAGPQLGVTHVSVKRPGIAETGGGAFALDVAKRTYEATFLTADVKLEAPGGESLRPWVALGMRRKIGGDAIRATAAFSGSNISYTVMGADRAATTAHTAGGVNVAVTDTLSLFVNGDVEFSGSNGQQQVNGGISFRF